MDLLAVFNTYYTIVIPYYCYIELYQCNCYYCDKTSHLQMDHCFSAHITENTYVYLFIHPYFCQIN